MFRILKNPLSSSLFFFFYCLASFGSLEYAPTSMDTRSVLGIKTRFQGLDYCCPLSSVVFLPQENSCEAGC